MSKANPFTVPDYRRWFAASSIQDLSIGLLLAISLAIYDATRNAGLVGIITGIATALELAAAMLGGFFADRYRRKRLMLIAAAISLLANLLFVALLIVAATVKHQPGTGLYAGLSPASLAWLITGLLMATFLAAASRGFGEPAADGALKSLISPDQFPRAASAAHARSSTLAIIGSPLSGLLYGLSPYLPFLVRALVDIGFMGLIRHVRTDLGPAKSPSQPDPNFRPHGFVQSYRECFTFLRSHQALWRILISAPPLNFLVFGTTSWTILHLRNIHTNSLTIGTITAGFALGGVLGSLLTPFFTDRFSAGFLTISGLSMMVIFYAVYYAVSPNPLWMFIIAILCMLPSPIFNAGLFGYVFTITPIPLQGRVQATFSLVGGLGPIVGAAAAGMAVSHHVDFLFTLILCGAGVLGVLLLAGSSAVRKIGQAH